MLSFKTSFRKVQNFKIDFWSAQPRWPHLDFDFSLFFQPCFCYVLATPCAGLAGYLPLLLRNQTWTSSFSPLLSVQWTWYAQTIRAESPLNTSLASPKSMRRDQNFILSWDGCIAGTAMSGPRTKAWQGHSRTRCRWNLCCKHCKAGLPFVRDGELFCACMRCPGISAALQTALASAKLGKP